MKTAKKFIEEALHLEPFTDDNVHMETDLTWDTILIIMQRYGDYRESNAPLPISIQEALNSGDGTYRP